MKVYEILHEMAWPDKFYQLERRVRSSNMTMQQLIDLLRDKYNIIVQPQTSLDYDPLTAGSASITPLTLTAKDIPNAPEHIKQELIGRRVLSIELGPGVEPSTPVKEVGGLLGVLRHEMAHYQQGTSMPVDKTVAMGKQYVSADSEQAATSQQNVMYALQAIERSPQVVDMASYIAQIGGTPEGFQQAIKRTKQQIYDTPDEGQEINDVAINVAAQEMERAMGIDSQERANELFFTGSHTAMRMVHVTIAQQAMASLAADHTDDPQLKKRLRGQLHQYAKLLQKRFPKVNAYYQRHRDDDIKSFTKNNPTRHEIQQQLEILARLGDMLGSVMGD